LFKIETMGCRCCRARNLHEDGTGLKKEGEKDAAFKYYKKKTLSDKMKEIKFHIEMKKELNEGAKTKKSHHHNNLTV